VDLKRNVETGDANDNGDRDGHGCGKRYVDGSNMENEMWRDQCLMKQAGIGHQSKIHFLSMQTKALACAIGALRARERRTNEKSLCGERNREFLA
jgi:hypothetical protein